MDVRKLLRRDNIRLVAVTTAFAVIGMSAPAVSQDVRAQLGLNADKVDGKDAVGYSAPAWKRKGRLVATHPRTGRLPSSAMAKAPDSSQLAGLSSSAYTTRTAKPGQVMGGVYAVAGSAPGAWMTIHAQFDSALLAGLVQGQTTFITRGGAYTAACPGPGRVVPRGHLCVYEKDGYDRHTPYTFDPSSGYVGAARTGFGLGMYSASTFAYSYGTWLVKAPSSSSARTAPQSGPKAPGARP